MSPSSTGFQGRPSGDRVCKEVADLALRLSQVEINVPIEPRVFDIEVPKDAVPLTLEELRRSDPWRQGPRVSPKFLRLMVRAHAKVNLDLRIFGTRPDGYHELRTVFQSDRASRLLALRPTSWTVPPEIALRRHPAGPLEPGGKQRRRCEGARS